MASLEQARWTQRAKINLGRQTKHGAISVRGGLSSPTLKILVSIRGLPLSWHHLGYLHQVHAGITHPKGHYLSLKSQLVQLADLSPYGLLLQVNLWVLRLLQSGKARGFITIYESVSPFDRDTLFNLNSFQKTTMALVNPISVTIPAELDNSTKFTRPISVSLTASTSAIVATENDDRTGLVLRNPGAYDVYLCLGETAATSSAIAVIEPNGYYELSPSDYNGRVSAICPAGAGSIAGAELSSTAFSAAVPLGVQLRRVGAELQQSTDGTAWSNFNGVSDAVDAFVSGPRLYMLNAAGGYNWIEYANPTTGWNGIGAQEFLDAKAQAGSVVL